MICCQEINDYLEYYSQCPNCFCIEQKLLIENIVKPTLARTDVFFDEETFHNCLKFCELWFYPLLPYQKFVTAFIFMYKDDIPIFRTFFIVMGRGNGKDGWMVPVCLFLTSEYYGVEEYNVDMIANSEQQIKGTYEVAYKMLENNPEKMKKHFYWNKEEITNNRTGSRLKWWTSSAKSSDGKRPGLILYNEYHAYKKDDVENTNSSGLGKKRHSRVIIITSNGLEREGSFDNMFEVCSNILQTGENLLKIFPFINKLDKEEEVDNKDLWIKANPSINYMPILKNEINDAYNELPSFPSRKNEFMAKRMGLPQHDEEEAVTDLEKVLKACFKDVKKRIPRDLPELSGKSAIIGIDYASLNDFASVGFLIKNDKEYCFRGKTFICKKNKYYKSIKFKFEKRGMPGYEDFEELNTDYISEDLIIDYVLKLISELNIKRIYLDNYKFQLLKKAFDKAGITLYDKKNNPSGLIEIIRYPASIAAIIGPKLEILLSKEQLNLGNSAMMRWCISNTYMKSKKDGNKYFEKVEPKLRKNDLFMALVCALVGIELLDEDNELYAYF